MPRGIPKVKTEAAELKIAQSNPLNIPTTGVLGDLARPDHDVVIVAEGPSVDDYAKELAFMEEIVEVMVHEAQGEFPDRVVDVYCNGVPQRFIRGEPVKVRRKFVEVLANARTQNMRTNVVREGDNVFNRVDKHTSLRYPFQMIDPNPKGNAWLRGLLGKTS